MTSAIINWRAPLALAALALVPAVAAFLWWSLQRRREALAKFAAASLLPELVPDLDPRRRTIRAGVLIAAVALLVVTIAGPMWGFRWEEVHREGIDLIVAIDTSRSMLATDIKPSRLARAKLAVRDLLTDLHGDRIGLVAFAGSAFVQCPLTLDYGALGQSLDALDVGIIPKGGTALVAAIDTSLEAFQGREGKHQAIILITDGEDHEGKVKEAAARASERGVRIFTVGLGTTEGELIPNAAGGYLKDRSGQVVKSRLDETTLQEIAVDTGAVYLHATGASLALTDLYRDYIGTMEKRELASTLERRFEQRFQIPLALALLLLVIEPLIGDRRVALRRRRRRGASAAPAEPANGRVLTAALLLALSSIAWLDPQAHVRAANRLYNTGKYDDAAAAYNQALVDQPDSALLHFNLGDAAYKQGKYDDALAAFQKVPAIDEDPKRAARTAYNLANTTYRLAEAAAASEPQKALKLYDDALIAYRRAIVAAPDDADAKLNYELVLQKRAELQKKLEEQKQQQDQQQQDQQQKQDDKQQAGDQQQQEEQKQQEGQPEEKPQDQGEPQKQDQPQPDQGEQQAEQQPEPSPAPQQQAGGNESPGPAATPPGNANANAAANEGAEDAANAEAAAGEEGEKKDGEMTRPEAAALLDAQRAEEVPPGDVVRRLQGAAVAEPSQDW